jgi:preprotein translocase subunit SecG
MLILNVVYVLLAIAMIALILMQRGAGAQAGSGFGSGASATVFGARGSSNFMSKATKWLAIVFFGISMYMAWYATHSSKPAETPTQQDAGLMSDTAPKPGEKPVPAAIPQAPSPLPAAPTQALPVPSAPAPTTPATPTPAPAKPPAPAPQGG